ncbi:MAG: cardiolipin synthase [Planctomycetaceae bacterium]|nr:cardiolipin synthase [Planctomycetaceae bacterium]
MVVASLVPELATLLHFIVATCISARVIMRKPAVGVALAWMFLVTAIPLVGAVCYLLIGERRVGARRARRIARLRTDYARLAQAVIDRGMTELDWNAHRPEARGMDRLGTSLVGIPTVAGSTGRLLTDAQEILSSLVTDIDAARKSILIEFYIWNEGGLADEVLNALIRAAQRGVSCRVLIDAIGARPWWKGTQPDQLRQAGVNVQAALPAGLWQMVFGRNDLRLHRKIVVIDGEVAYTGSMNLVDPRFFKQDADVGQWVDAMLRVEGTIVVPLALVMIGDWMLETDETIEKIVETAGLKFVEPQGKSDAQVVPSGPVETDDGLLQMLLALVNAAREELVLTTPYFVPDESLMRAIRGAAGRGVQVHLILPEKVDSLLTRYASRSYYEELMDVGVNIHLYRKGLLHTKSITADRSLSMFGTVNLDMRSLWLNYEVSLFVYGQAFGEHLHSLQQSYIDESDQLDASTWGRRPYHEKLLENTLRLVSPVL